MKKSKYNHLSERSEYVVLYNCSSDSICQLDPDLAYIYHSNTPKEIKLIHPEFYSFLVENKFLVNENIDEYESVVRHWKEQDLSSDRISVSINPTLNCNLDCWYCYENHDGNRMMQDDVYEKMLSYCRDVLFNTVKSQIHFGFFGGEPLLNFNKVVKPLITEVVNISTRLNNKKDVSFSFVTNGTLINKEFIKFIDELEFPCSFQITMDGNKSAHDSIRKSKKGGEGTYDLILDNCVRLLALSNTTIILRCNYTYDNILTFIDLADSIQKKRINDHPRLWVDFHQVWQDRNVSNLKEVEEHLGIVRDVFIRKGIKISLPKRISKYRCYADTGNSILVNYNGDVFRCTARDFTPQCREGELNHDGTLSLNKLSELRDRVKWGNSSCKLCQIYPICHGGCSQNIIEHLGEEECYFKYSALQKEQIMEDRISHLLANVKNKY